MKIFARLSWAYATFVIFFGMTLMILIFPFFRSPKSQKIASWFIRLFIFLPVRVEGKEDPDAQMFLINHQSDVDIGVMETITKRNLAWVAKKELFDVPFYGLLLKLPQDIAVERESKTSLVKLIRDVKSRLDDNRVITMFPEGTRTATGRMRKFKPGAKMVADKYQLRVQPIVIVEAAKRYNIKEYHYRPAPIKAIFMEPFVADKSDPKWLDDLQVKMQKVYDDAVAQG